MYTVQLGKIKLVSSDGNRLERLMQHLGSCIAHVFRAAFDFNCDSGAGHKARLCTDTSRSSLKCNQGRKQLIYSDGGQNYCDLLLFL